MKERGMMENGAAETLFKYVRKEFASIKRQLARIERAVQPPKRRPSASAPR